MRAEAQLELPPSVRRQLAVFRRRLLWVETLLAVLGALAAVVGVYLVLFVSDRLWDTPMAVRLTLAALALAGLAVGGWFWLSRWGWRQRNARELATLAQRHFPKLGDRLLGIVELAEERGLPDSMSPALRQAALAQVAREAADLDFRAAAPTERPRHFAWALAALIAVVGLGFALAPGAGWNALQRLVKPVASIARYTLVRLTGLPAERVVAHGEPFSVAASLTEDSRWAPASARGRFEDQPAIAAPRAGREFRFDLPGQTRAGVLAIQAGDARERVAIRPTHRPELARLDMVIEYPAYLAQPVATQAVAAARVELVRGSTVAFTGLATRALASVEVDGEPVPVGAARFTVPPRALTRAGVWKLEWRDTLGLAGKQPLELRMVAREDAPPRVRCRALEQVVAMLEDEVLQFEVVAEDDFGVRTLGIEWAADGNEDRGVAPSTGAAALATGDPQRRQLSGGYRFAPAAMGIGPQKVTLHATAEDYRPDGQAARSSPHVIYVLDRIEHAKLVQQRLERLQERLEEIARLEESLFELNERLREQLDDPNIAERLREQQRAEEANLEALKRLQEAGAELLKEALRNKTIDEAVLRQWAEALQKLQAIAQQDMPAVAAKLGESRESAGEQRAGKLNEALTKQQEALRKMQEALQQMGETGEQLMAGNFVNRLRQASALEQELGADLTRLLPEIIGAPVQQLPASARAKLGRVEERQRRNQRNVRHVRDDLAGFYNRTRRTVYGTVHDEMQEQRVVDELERLAERIAANLGAQAVQDTARWSGQLTAWADLLEGAKDSGSAGGGEGDGELSPEMMELVLRLMRLRQAEEGLRDQTRFLEDHKAENPLYAASTQRMASLQTSLRGVVERTKREYPIPELIGLLNDVEIAMKDAERLLTIPRTDDATIAAETEVIELLSLASQQAASSAGGGSGGAASSWLAALMQMLGMGLGAGQSPGAGSMAGGTTDQPNQPVASPAAGRADPERAVDQATGRDRGAFPAEFRDALDAYFRALEEGTP